MDLSVQGTSALVSSTEAILDSYMEGAAVQKDDRQKEHFRLKIKTQGPDKI